jgi:hypothetical protein
MLLRADPNVSITPFAQVSQFLYFWMGVVFVVFDGQSSWVVHANIATKTEEYAASFIGQ